MTFRYPVRPVLFVLAMALVIGAYPAAADSSHARIVRLSLVQGDVRFAREVHGDALADDKAVWETAALNLPIRQGYVLATDHGRAEVEFENGAMAFLSENTVLEFYDLSLEDGGRTTRLVLRQGTASFYVNPASEDYFSVTGGDFTVEASRRTSFRLDNFDDGSSVNVFKGRVNILHQKETTALGQGQSLSMRAGEDSSLSIGRLSENDDFDLWVSGRIDSSVTATTAATQYTSGASSYYSSGFGDLYTYGGWYPFAGYGYCWRPYGVGAAWSPFSYGFGSWYSDPVFGWTFIGNQPWGWLPYHYGAWLFEPGFGWVWAPVGFASVSRPIRFRPVTGVFVHSGTSLALVPLHPMDARGKTPINLRQGAFPIHEGRILETMVPAGSMEWRALKEAPREALTGGVITAEAPVRYSRTVLAGNSGARVVTFGKDSSIIYDPKEHRFVNNTRIPVESPAKGAETRGEEQNGDASARAATGAKAPGLPEGVAVAGDARTAGGTESRDNTRPFEPPRASRAMTPPPPRNLGSGGERGGGSSAGSYRGGGGGGSSSSHPSSSAPSHPSGGGRPH